MRVADYIVKWLFEYGVRDVFMISGGGAMYLNDAFGSHPNLRYICNHHEQASAMAAEGYARASGKIGVVVVTSGPGGTNTLTGVIGQWLDSIPVLFISGQVKQETTIESCRDIGLRQLGDQEINIVDIVRPVTKFAAIVSNPDDVRYFVEKAVFTAVNGRPGPVWLDIPLDVQGAQIDENGLKPFIPHSSVKVSRCDFENVISRVVDKLVSSRRPLIVAGHGIRISGAQQEFLILLEKLGIPVVTTFSGFDLVADDHLLYAGRIGTIGTRSGNFAIQNADCVLFIGTRNNIRQVSYNWKSYARAAYKIVIDIDPSELKKSTLIPDLPICIDAGEFIRGLSARILGILLPSWNQWVEYCQKLKMRYPAVLPSYRETRCGVHPYHFIDRLTEFMPDDVVVVAGNGTACVVLFQAGNVKPGQRMFWNSGCASMGYDLPAAIGACFATGKKEVICLVGDGSLQMNIQELQTVVHHQLPIKLIVLNNEGYVSIKQTQDTFFDGRRTGCDSTSGVSFPEITKIAMAYGIPTLLIETHTDLDYQIKRVLAMQGPIVCEVRLVPDYKFEPKLSSVKLPDGRIISKPLEDMFPFLERSEFLKNMLIQEWNGHS